ncbi:c-type cytochrome [Hydrogenimonas sp.]
MRRMVHGALVGALLLGFAGCGDKKEEKEASRPAAPGQIKVTEGAVKEKAETQKSKANSGQFYYSYNEEKSGESNESGAYRTTLDAYLHIRSPYERVQIELMIKKLSKDFIVRCSPCHDDYANGVIGPSLLGKDGDFIYGRLMDFKSGKRENILMKELVAQIDDKTLRNIADEIAAFNKQIQEMRRKRQ